MKKDIEKLQKCLLIAVDSLINIANTETNLPSKLRAKDTVVEINRILNKK